MRLIGTIDARVDQKGRVFLPVLFRRTMTEVDGGRWILRTNVFEHCLVLYPEQEWFARLDELHARLSVWNREDEQILRQFVADAEWITLDAGGRLLIPKRYMKMADIKQNVTFIGMDSTIEIWAKELRQEQQENFGEALQKRMAENNKSLPTDDK